MAQVQYTQGQLKVPSQSNLSGGTKSSYSGLSKKLLKVVRFEIGFVLITDTEQLGTRFLSAHLTRDLSPWVKEFRRIMNLSDLNGTKLVLADSEGPSSNPGTHGISKRSHLIGFLQDRDPIPELDVLDVERLELFLDVPEDGVKSGLGVRRKDGVVVAGTSPVFSKA